MVALAGDAVNPVVLVYEDKQLTSKRFDKLCKELSTKGITIKRFIYQENREQFMANKDLWLSIAYTGIELLPATYINNDLMKIETYPTRAELDIWLNNAEWR